PLDRVAGHVGVAGLVDGVAQGQVARRVGAPVLGGDDDRLGALGPGLAALLVHGGLAVLDVVPLAVTGHGESSALTRDVITGSRRTGRPGAASRHGRPRAWQTPAPGGR